MDQFLDAYDRPKFNWEDTNDLNVSMTRSEMEAMNKFPTAAQVWADSMQNSPEKNEY